MSELKSRMVMDAATQGQQKRAGQGLGPTKDDRLSGKQEPMPLETVIRKVDYYMQEIQHLLGNVTANTDRLLGRSTHAESPDRGYT